MAFTFLQSIYKLRLTCFRNVVNSNLKDIARTRIECKNLNCKGFQHRTTLTLLDIQNQIDQGIRDIDNINFDLHNEIDSPKLPCGILKYDDQPSICGSNDEKIVNC
jgi:hypothetical protein